MIHPVRPRDTRLRNERFAIRITSRKQTLRIFNVYRVSTATTVTRTRLNITFITWSVVLFNSAVFEQVNILWY
jgi:hypothetical protein